MVWIDLQSAAAFKVILVHQNNDKMAMAYHQSTTSFSLNMVKLHITMINRLQTHLVLSVVIYIHRNSH